MWVVYALLSALFAALTSIFAKIGMEGINSNLATAISEYYALREPAVRDWLSH